MTQTGFKFIAVAKTCQEQDSLPKMQDELKQDLHASSILLASFARSGDLPVDSSPCFAESLFKQQR